MQLFIQGSVNGQLINPNSRFDKVGLFVHPRFSWLRQHRYYRIGIMVIAKICHVLQLFCSNGKGGLFYFTLRVRGGVKRFDVSFAAGLFFAPEGLI